MRIVLSFTGSSITLDLKKNCKREAVIGRLYTCFFPSWPEIRLFEHFGAPIGIRPMKQQGNVANAFSCRKGCLKKQSPQLANKRQDIKRHKVIACKQ